MRELRLGNSDQSAFVDDDIYEWARNLTWSLSINGYVIYQISLKVNEKWTTRILYLHQLVTEAYNLPENSKLEVDHQDTNKLNNQRSNLRFATRSQNNQNREKQINNTTGFKGVVYKPNLTKPYMAQIKLDGKLKYLGYFTTAVLAYEAYCKAARLYFGEFARLD